MAKTSSASAVKNDPMLAALNENSNRNTNKAINAQNASIDKLIRSLTGPGSGTGQGGFGGVGGAGVTGAGAGAGANAANMMGGPNITINVYPSEGMDERELAAMVSRELAVQLRRGGAGT